MHEPVYPITTAAAARQAPAHLKPPLPAHEIPPGVEIVTLPGGIRTLAYTQHPAPAAPLQPVAQPIPAWAKTTALLCPTVGGGIAAGGIGLSYAAPGLIAMSHVLWAAVALIAAGAIAAPTLMRAGRHGANTAAPTQINQTITATGLFGRANGTINHH